jgi:hypothetical protein
MRAYIRLGVFLAITVGIATGNLLYATTITSYNFSDWQATVQPGSAQDVNFAGLPYISFGSSGYTTSDGFNITGPDGEATSLQGLLFNGYPSLKGGSDADAQVVVTPPSGETAMVFSIGSSPSASGYTLTLSDGEIFNLAANTTLFGISVSHPITSATFSVESGSSFVLSYVGYGTTTLALDGGPSGDDPSSTPEVSTLFLIGTGLLLIGKFRRISFL